MSRIAVVILIVFAGIAGLGRWVLQDDAGPAASALRAEIGRQVARVIGRYDVAAEKVRGVIELTRSEVSRLQAVEANDSVEAKYLRQDLQSAGEQLGQARSGLLRLADLIERGEPVPGEAGTYSLADLRAMAGGKKAQFEALRGRMETLEVAARQFEENAERAHRAWVSAEQRLGLMEAKQRHAESLIALLQARDAGFAALDAEGATDAGHQVELILDDLLKEREKLLALEGIRSKGRAVRAELPGSVQSGPELAGHLRALVAEKP